MQWIKSIVTAATLASLSAVSWAQERPNIIVMVADDLGWADVGFNGGKDIDTPSLDRIAGEGVKLERFYTTPICSPTRAAMMTGRDPMRLGVAYATIMPWSNVGVHPDEHFMPESFQSAGYQTAMVGKWHLGHSQQTYHPNDRGFEHFYGHLHTEVGYFPPFANQGGKDFQQNGESIDDQGYESYLLGDEVSRWIKERDKNKPFFVYMPFIAPHTPLDAPADLQAKYADLKDTRKPARTKRGDGPRQMAKQAGRPSERPMYAAVVDGMDQAIGRVLKTLDDEGLAENTIVLFFSDNGGAVYGGADNVPFRGGKGDTFEGGIRVAAALRWPESIPGGGQVDSAISVMDLFPTLAAAANVKTQNTFEFDGRNMLEALTDNKTIPLDEYLYFASETPIRGEFSLTAFNDKWKLVQEVKQGQMSTDVENFLFRIDQDPHEENNLAAKHPERVKEMAAAISSWRTLYPVAGTRSELVPPPGWRAPLDWAGYPQPVNQLQSTPATGMPPPPLLRMLDKQHGDTGRLIYNCDPRSTPSGLCPQ